jgi:cytochrome c peroxidase
MTVRTPVRAIALAAVLWMAATTLAATAKLSGDTMPNMLAFPNEAGTTRTFSVNGEIDLNNPFFQSLGSNGRACVTCHQPSDAWTVTPAHIQERFDASDGLDPIFRTNDGSNSPAADVSTVDARRSAFSMLLSKGLIRVGIGIPDGAEFELIDVDDPYGFASAAELSLFRRPLPSTNLRFLSAVMWDGRETFKGESMNFDLLDQANAATLGHAAAQHPLSVQQREAIVNFEVGLYTAQTDDRLVGELRTHGADGGPTPLSAQPFAIGANDVLGPGFTSHVFSTFDSWKDPTQLLTARGPARDPKPGDEARRSIARGQEIFNSRPIAITEVKGLNDALGVATLPGTCTTCHDTPNVGNHSVSLPLDLGLTTEAMRTADMPLYTLRNKATGQIVKTTDPGRALITGRWKDVSLFKGPILRALAARAPYFHNGAAATLRDVVEFYDSRFNLGLTPREKTDLIAFLKAL